MIRILHVIKDLSLGGAETNLGNLLDYFSREGYEHHVACAGGGELEQRFLAARNVKLYKFADKAPKMASWQSFSIVAKLVSYIWRHRIDIVHTHNFNGQFWGLFAAKIAGAKLLEHVHDFRYFEPLELERRGGSAKLNRFIPIFKGHSDRVVVLTSQNRDFLLWHHYYPAEKVCLQPNGIAPRENSAAAAEIPGLPPSSAVILTASRMVKPKNIQILFSVVPAILAQYPECLFLVAGDGELLEGFRLRAQGSQFRSRLKFIGFHQDIAGLMARADVYLQPSLLELHSIALLEAMSAGLPVLLSSGVGNNDNFIRNWENGVLLDPRDPGAWSEALLQILRDPGFRREMGEQGRKTCNWLFDATTVARSIEGIYDSLVQE